MNAEFPEKLAFLFEPHRYKVSYSGRGAAKSWSYAQAMLILGSMVPLRIVCARENMNTIGESVHQLLEDQIKRLRFNEKYKVEKARIIGNLGTEIIFIGLQHNPDAIKSLEGADILWVEEAQNVSKASWDIVVPTVRKDHVNFGRYEGPSEIWVSFNPKLRTDATWKRFIVNPPTDSIVVKLSWQDNPWFPAVLDVERLDCLRIDPDGYQNIWEGEPTGQIIGAIYGSEMRAAVAEGRICSVPYDRTRPVDTFWDLGFGDTNSIWFMQPYGGWYNFIDYMEGTGLTLADYCVQLQGRGYVYGTDFLPHDGVDAIIHRNLSGDRSKSPEMVLRSAGRKVRIAPKLHVNTGINAVRTILPQCRFDEARCADGIQGLNHYQWDALKIDDQTGRPVDTKGREARIPLHNFASHPADGLRTAAVAVRMPKDVPPPPEHPKMLPQPPRISGVYAPFG